MTRGDTFFGFLVGALAGVAVALLYAPQSGQETRQRLRETGREAGQKVLETGQKAKETLAEVKDSVERSVSEAMTKVTSDRAATTPYDHRAEGFR